MPTGTLTAFPVSEEYVKNPGIKPEDVAKLREWLKTQPHLPDQYITDLDIVLAYHCCDQSVAVTKQVLDMHFTLKTHLTTLFKDRVVDVKIEQALNKYLMTLLPSRSKEGFAYMYLHFLDYTPKNFILLDTMRAAMMLLDVWQLVQGTWPGLVLLVDLEGIGVGHLTNFNFHITQQLLYYLQEALLVKIKGLHFLNAPFFMDKLMTLLKPFMKKSLLEMVYIHQTGSHSLEPHCPKDYLPKDAGGKHKTFEECRDEVISTMKAAHEYFELDQKKRVVEALRPGKPTSLEDIFGGVEGSFKKLDID